MDSFFVTLSGRVYHNKHQGNTPHERAEIRNQLILDLLKEEWFLELTITLPSEVVAFLQKFADNHNMPLKEFIETALTEYYQFSELYPLDKEKAGS